MSQYKILLSLVLLSSALAPLGSAIAEVKRPNIIVILADDLGYADLGAFGSEIKTPNLDKLATRGRVLRNFYTQPTCSPTRSELISGIDHHLAGVGTMAELVAPQQAGKPGYEGVLDNRVIPLPALIKEAGYNTYLAGKWHLGAAPDHRPGARGFNRSYALYPGGASHFKQPVQRLAAAAPEPLYTENDVPVEIPENFFSSNTYTDKLIEYIDADHDSGKPFFGYLAYTAPHWPIQAPDTNLAKVKGRYDVGYEVIAKRRFDRQKVLRIAAPNAVQPPLPEGIKKWEELTPIEQTQSARTYEAYAAAVENLDDNVGRLIQHLSDIGELENTFIFFFSDNGAEGNEILKTGRATGNLTGQQAYDNSIAWLKNNFDNSTNNIGRKNSYVWLKEGWGQASSLPNRLFKGTTTEGGVRVPAFVYYPKAVRPGKADAVVTVRDVLPTALDLAGTRHPGISYNGKTVLPIQGTSALPYLTGKDTLVHSDSTAYGFELFGKSALRKGDWKIVRLYEPVGDGHWQLFNLANDPSELKDLSGVNAYRSKLNELKRDWKVYVIQNNVIELGYDFAYGWIDDTLPKDPVPNI